MLVFLHPIWESTNVQSCRKNQRLQLQKQWPINVSECLSGIQRLSVHHVIHILWRSFCKVSKNHITKILSLQQVSKLRKQYNRLHCKKLRLYYKISSFHIVVCICIIFSHSPFIYVLHYLRILNVYIPRYIQIDIWFLFNLIIFFSKSIRPKRIAKNQKDIKLRQPKKKINVETQTFPINAVRNNSPSKNWKICEVFLALLQVMKKGTMEKIR